MNQEDRILQLEVLLDALLELLIQSGTISRDQMQDKIVELSGLEDQDAKED